MGSKVTFMCETDDYHTDSIAVLSDHNLIISFDASDATIHDMIDQFELFLKASGYVFNHQHLALVQSHTHTEVDNSMRIDDHEFAPTKKTRESSIF